MVQNIDPEKYGLSGRTKLVLNDDKILYIQKLIKSRIINKDALKIIEQSNAIKAINPDVKVGLECYDNICSKSIKLLKENNIPIKIAK